MIKHSVATGQDLHSTRSGFLLQKKKTTKKYKNNENILSLTKRTPCPKK